MDIKIDDLTKYKHIHLIGIGGISMSAIAETLHNWKYTVTGSDAVQSKITDTLNSHGIKTIIGHDLENSKKADLIVYSAIILLAYFYISLLNSVSRQDLKQTQIIREVSIRGASINATVAHHVVRSFDNEI